MDPRLRGDDSFGLEEAFLRLPHQLQPTLVSKPARFALSRCEKRLRPAGFCNRTVTSSPPEVARGNFQGSEQRVISEDVGVGDQPIKPLPETL